MRGIVSSVHRNAKSGSTTFFRFGMLTLVAGLGAGCSADAIRFSDPIFTSSTKNQQNTIAGRQTANNQPVPPRPTTGGYASNSHIESRPLPQPSGANAQATQAARANTGYSAPAATGPKPYTPPKTYVASGQPKPLGTMPVSASAAPKLKSGSTVSTYKVQPGDSLWIIAKRNGTSVKALRETNNLKGNNIRLGQTLIIPNGAAKAPVQVAAVTPSTMSDATVPSRLPASRPKTTRVAVAQPKPVEVKPAPYTPPVAANPAKTEAPAPSTPAPVKTVKAAPDSGSGFRWPVRGRIISGFGKKPNGERNDGIDLAVPEGTEVKAAESGVVIYAGNELKSYGNLVLVKHENGWVSAYAHNKELLVKRGDKVQRGQVISKAGRSGGVDTPQVHFELRKGATPVDPMKYLSAS